MKKSMNFSLECAGKKMPKYIAALDSYHQYDTYGNSIYREAIGVDYLELSQEDYNAFRLEFSMNGIVLLEVVDSPQVLLEKFRTERVEKLRKKAEEKRKQKAEKRRQKLEEQQLEAARKLLREKGELQ